MKRISIFLVVLLSLCSCNRRNIAQSALNLDFEIRDYDGPSLPFNWFAGGEGYKVALDSIEKHHGMFSLKMEKIDNTNGKEGVFTGSLPVETFAGKNVEYRGWIKTKDVKNGYVGLWLRVDGADRKTLGGGTTYDRGLKGDNDWTQVSIKVDVSKDAANINFGGAFLEKGIVWFDDLELYINGKKYIDAEPELKKTLSQKEIATLKKYIYPLRTYEPDGGDTKDLKILDKLIGNSNVVALGEVSHGSSEVYKMKNRIIQYLAENNGFNMFSIEANMPESYKLNDYTVRGEGDPKKLIAGMYFRTWNTEEMLNLVEWMRKFNQPKQRIEFTGFDMQRFGGAVNELYDAFKENKDIESKIDSLKTKLNEIKVQAEQNYGLINVGNDERKEIDSILNCIEMSSFQKPEKTWLQQNIVIIDQYLGSNHIFWHDKCMADNFMWIKEHNPNSKFIIWAHNRHIGNTFSTMGSYLAQKFGDNYTAFGFTFFDGNCMSLASNGLTSYEAAPAYPGTLEYLLNQLNEPVFILDLKKIKSDNSKDTEWLRGQLHYRFIGAKAGEGMNGGFTNRKITDDFDYLIFIKTSSPSHLLTNSQ